MAYTLGAAPVARTSSSAASRASTTLASIRAIFFHIGGGLGLALVGCARGSGVRRVGAARASGAAGVARTRQRPGEDRLRLGVGVGVLVAHPVALAGAGRKIGSRVDHLEAGGA